MSAIRIVRGEYRNQSEDNQVFTLVSGFQSGAKGNFVTVKNDGNFPNCPDTVRVRVDSIADIEYTNAMTTEKPAEPTQARVAETDEEVLVECMSKHLQIYVEILVICPTVC